ncbi:MAG: esterase [Alphaproteobacteria bacterium]|nr:esterase [Alphaproteobacteria bacterium]
MPSEHGADGSEPWLALSDMGSFHVGGRKAIISGKAPRLATLRPGDAPVTIDPNGTYQVDQLYAQYFIPHRVRGEAALLLWHGAPLTGVTYETTPDGREGWATHFVRLGWSVYVSDAVERGRSGWALFPDIWPGDPVFTRHDRYFDTDFRIGKGPGAYSPDLEVLRANLLPGSRFPAEAYEGLAKQLVPRWRCNDEAILDAYVALVDRVGPCVIVAHSQATRYVFRVAQRRPGHVRGIVAVEPIPIEGDDGRIDVLRDTRMLYLWGDFLETDPEWPAIRDGAHAFRDRMIAGGVSVETIELPKIGIRGNSHMMMMDTNNLDVADVIQSWLAKQGLYRS